MNNWKETTLGDVITLQRGFDLPVKRRKSGEYPLMAANGQDGYHSEYKVTGPGVVTGRSGTLGYVYYVKENFWPLNTTLWVKDFKGNNVKFIYYFSHTLHLDHYNTGTGVPTLNRNFIHPLKITIPEAKEQKGIAAVLSSLDDKIELLQNQNKTFEKIAQATFKRWFVEFEFPFDKDGNHLPAEALAKGGYKSSGGKMVESELGEIPEGWRSGKVRELGKVVCGKTPPKEKKEYFGGNTPFIKIPDMHNQMFIINTDDSLTSEGANSQKNKFIPKNSICVSCIATVGLVSLTTKDSQTNQQINSLVPKNENWTEYIYFTFKRMSHFLNTVGSGGTATLNINTSIFSNLDFILPEEEIIKEYHGHTKPLFDKLLQNNYQIQTLSRLRDTLLPKLMSGEVRVKI